MFSELWVHKSIRQKNRFRELWFLRSQERGSAPSVSLWHGELFSALVSESYHCLNSSEELYLWWHQECFMNDHMTNIFSRQKRFRAPFSDPAVETANSFKVLVDVVAVIVVVIDVECRRYDWTNIVDTHSKLSKASVQKKKTFHKPIFCWKEIAFGCLVK